MRASTLPRLVTSVGTLLATMGTLTVGAPGAAGAQPPRRAPVIGHFSSTGPLEPVPDMQSGLPTGAFGVAVLGTLGGDLYLFGSQSETTGAIKGVWRYRSGSWSKLGEPSRPLDYNRLAMYGAVEYLGSLYIGDRRGGNLYKLVLNADGSFRDVVSVANIGNEDVFPGPVWKGNLVLGTFGAYSTGENAGLYTYNGEAVTKRFDFSDLGNAGWVTSIVLHEDEVWASAINPSVTLSQVWKFDRSFNATLMYSGPADYRLVTSGRSLFAVRTVYSYPYETHHFAKWDDRQFVRVSHETPLMGMIGSVGSFSLNGSLLDLTYYNGIYAYREGGSLQQLVPGMPAMGAPMSVVYHDGFLWMATNQPVGLYRMKIGFGSPPVPSETDARQRRVLDYPNVIRLTDHSERRSFP